MANTVHHWPLSPRRARVNVAVSRKRASLALRWVAFGCRAAGRIGDFEGVFERPMLENRIVAPVVAGSIPVIHPSKCRKSNMRGRASRLVFSGRRPGNLSRRTRTYIS